MTRDVIDTVILDVDFTLIRPIAVFDAPGYVKLARSFGVELEESRYAAARLGALHVFHGASLEHQRASHETFAAAIVRGMGASQDEALEIGTAAEHAWGDPVNFGLFDDVRPAVAELRRAALKIGLLSNSDRDLRTFFAPFDLPIDFVMTSGEHGRRKPCATIFEATLARAGSQAQRSVMVGDSLRDDIGGALAAGLSAVLVDRQDSHADHEGVRVRSLAELPAALGL